jgi:hypothetical protein
MRRVEEPFTGQDFGSARTGRSRGAQPLGGLVRSHRLAKPVSLHGMHAGRPQEQLLIGGLHNFRGDLHAEPAAETDHRVNNDSGIGCLLDRMNETANDLQFVEGESAQVQQVGIANAEIVERNVRAERLQSQQGGFDGVDMASGTLSGSSSSSWLRSKPVSVMIRSTVSTKPTCRNWSGETLTNSR